MWKREYQINGTAGILLTHKGVNYVTLENITFSADDHLFSENCDAGACAFITLEAPVRAVDGAQFVDDGESFEPVAMWTINSNDLDYWMDKNDWNNPEIFNGVLLDD